MVNTAIHWYNLPSSGGNFTESDQGCYYNGPIYNSKDSTKPVGDPESTVKLFELFRARCTEQLTKKLLLVLNRQILPE